MLRAVLLVWFQEPLYRVHRVGSDQVDIHLKILSGREGAVGFCHEDFPDCGPFNDIRMSKKGS